MTQRNLNLPAGEVPEPAINQPETPEARRRVDDPWVGEALEKLLAHVGSEPNALSTRLVKDLLVTGLKLIPDGRDTGELKLMTTALKEMRYAYRVFARYAEPHKVTIFGSARTPESHPDFQACVEFSRLMAQRGWMIITGAGLGIMKAGHVGPGREASFGVAIRLPFETNANPVIAGDEKLITFRYFFTRKLMFISQAEAVVLFPGGFGTMDEAYETLTLVQTGKSQPVPIVLMEGAGGDYWPNWDQWTRRNLLDRGLISPEDTGLYYVARDAADAADHIDRFYRVYHSSRYVKDDLVIRLKRPISPDYVAQLEQEFRTIIKAGSISLRGMYDVEDEHRDLPRLSFTHTKSHFGLVRRLIDRINEAPPVDALRADINPGPPGAARA